MIERILTSLNGRYLVTENGQPFFWMGDTAWELFHRCTLEEAALYLDNRRQLGFNVIQAVILAELDGLHVPNANGDLPLLHDDPTRLNEAYFRHVDAIIRMAAERDLYIGLLPTWGDKVNPMWGIGPAIFNPQNAQIYGRLLGKRYRDDPNIIWILGGDRPAKDDEAIWHAMASGIIEGSIYAPFITYHPTGSTSSSAWFHDADWLDMNMLQSGHCLLDTPNWDMITHDYNLTPIKPVLDGEPNYEDHPIDPYKRKWEPGMGRFTDYDVRKAAYRSVFSGACGHTYGHHSIWQFWREDREPMAFPNRTWERALESPGAAQLIHLKNLLLSRPYLTRIPDQDLLVDEPLPPPPTQEQRYDPRRARHPRACRDGCSRYALVYVPCANQTIRVNLEKLSGGMRASWFNPRTGEMTPLGSLENWGIESFTTPAEGPDWVLMLDVIGQGLPETGKLTYKHVNPL